MKKSNLVKVFSILIISLMVILFSTSVFAADNTGFNDLTNTLGNTNSNNSSNSNNANTNSNSSNTNKNTNVNNSNKADNSNSSIYNNTSLPKTGIEDSIPVALLVVVFGISSIYAYKKIKEYRNI